MIAVFLYYSEICRLYCKGVSPNFFLKAEMKWEVSKNPASSPAVVTEPPFARIIFAMESFFDSKNSFGEICTYFLKYLFKVAGLIKKASATSLIE